MDGNGDFHPFRYIKIWFIIQLKSHLAFISTKTAMRIPVPYLSYNKLTPWKSLDRKKVVESQVVGAEAPPHCSFACLLVGKFGDTLLILLVMY